MIDIITLPPHSSPSYGGDKRGCKKINKTREVLKVQFQMHPYAIAEMQILCAINNKPLCAINLSNGFILDVCSLHDWLSDI